MSNDDETVYRANALAMVRFAATVSGPADAPDVVMEAFLRVTRSSAWGNAANPVGLWRRAVVYEASSRHRSRFRRQARERRAFLLNERAPADGDLLTHQIDPRVRLALAQLSPQQRAIVFLTYWEDMAAASVAKELGVSSGSIKKQLSRARSKLREELQ